MLERVDFYIGSSHLMCQFRIPFYQRSDSLSELRLCASSHFDNRGPEFPQIRIKGHHGVLNHGHPPGRHPQKAVDITVNITRHSQF